MKSMVMGLALAAAVAAPMSAPVSAAVIYDSGPADGTYNAWVIGSGQDIGNVFTLATAATITDVRFAAWTSAGAVLNAVNWGFASGYGVLPTYQTATVSNGPIFSSPYGGSYDVRWTQFSTGGVTLPAGTYYLWLGNGITSNSSLAYWDMSNTSGPAVFAVSGIFAGAAGGDTPFQLLGTSGAVPEPASWAMMIAGFGLVGGALRARRTAVAA